MGVRELQALAAEAKAVSYETDAPTPAIEPALAKRIQSVRATVVNSTDTNSHAARTVAVMDDLEKALHERTAEFERIRRNYAGLHSICEEYHQQLEELREQAASGGEPEEMRRLKVENHRIPELEARARELSGRAEAAEAALAGVKAELAAASSALQEAAAEKKKLQQVVRAGQQAATHGGEELRALQQALQQAQQEVSRYKAGAAAAEASLKGIEMAAREDRRARRLLEEELEKVRRAADDGGRAAAASSAQLAMLQKQVDESNETMSRLQLEAKSATEQLAAERASWEEALAAQKQAADEAWAAAAAAKAEASRGTADLEAELERSKQAEVRMASRVMQLEEERDHVATLKQEVERLQREWAEVDKRAVQLEKERNAANEELQIQRELYRNRPTEPAPAPAPPPPPPKSMLPSVGEMQVQALRNELEGWQLVAEETKVHKERTESELATAYKTIKKLKDQLAALKSADVGAGKRVDTRFEACAPVDEQASASKIPTERSTAMPPLRDASASFSSRPTIDAANRK